VGLFSRFNKDKAPQVPWSPAPSADAPLPVAGRAEPLHASPAAAVDGVASAVRQHERFVVLDVETTGLSATQHRIVEVALVTTDIWGRVQDEWTTRLNPQGPVGATHIHGLKASDLQRAPVFTDIISELNARLAGAAIAAHNAKFDLAFLRAEYYRAGWILPYVPSLCTLEACDHHLPHLERRRLADCCWAIGQPLVDAHSALGDARATAQLLAAFMHPHMGPPPQPEHLGLPRHAVATAWPSAPSHAPGQPVPASFGPPAGHGRRPPPPPRVQRVLLESESTPPPPALVELLERFSLIDALDEGAPTGSLAYLEKLAEALEDGVLDDQEVADLAELAASQGLDAQAVTGANRAFVLALAHEALADGKVTRAERAELLHIAETLSVEATVVPRLLEQAETARNNRMSSGLGPLPDPWPHGAPLRVGDKVVFTGCEEARRTHLEQRSESLGVRVIGGVSAKTALLVSDGTMDGTKAAKARQLGTRVVDPDLYAVLLEHLQPSQPAVARHSSSPVAAPRAKAGAGAEQPVVQVVAGSPAQVRGWAKNNGWEVGVRGRLPRELLAAYAAAHTQAAVADGT
jgi:DNA polymerase-3 subunit epsilon